MAELVVVLDSAPPPLTLHVTPAAFLSLVTVAVSVTASFASTVVPDAVTAMANGLALPPHAEIYNPATNTRQMRAILFRDIELPKC